MGQIICRQILTLEEEWCKMCKHSALPLTHEYGESSAEYKEYNPALCDTPDHKLAANHPATMLESLWRPEAILMFSSVALN